MTEFLRLVRYAAPYRGRLVIALLAMLVYAAGSLGVVMQVEPIFNNVLPSAERVGDLSGLRIATYSVPPVLQPVL